ncbi:MAG: DNA-directed RNA polymerase subunit omega [Atribacterota bacterium]|nr:DNA-directed RNA polymerase subunit omega [Atribacterota bacterium]
MKENNCLENKYLLTMMVAKRAKQLNQGYKPLLVAEVKNNRQLALKEIREGKIYIKKEQDNLSAEIEDEGNQEEFEEEIIIESKEE